MNYGKKFLVKPGSKVRLDKIDPSYAGKHQSHETAVEETAKEIERMDRLQYLMYASASRSLLIVLQGLDAAGKDGVVRHLFTGMNPQGTKVFSFKEIRRYLASVQGDAAIHCSPIEWLEKTYWRQGRVVLIGDAAHAGSPMMGQGGSMALEDASTLAESLQTASDVPSALEAFVARRRERVEWVRGQSRATGEMLGQSPAVRNARLREHGKTAFYQRFTPLRADP